LKLETEQSLSPEIPLDKPPSKRLVEVIGLFLKLGFTAFGGPAAHVGLMHDEVVRRRRWITDQHFLDLLGATNLIPGPNSTEMAIHIGFTRAGWAGLLAGGFCFVLPASLMVLGLAWLYVHYGSMPQAEWLLYGIKPVMIAIIGQALWNLGTKAVRSTALALLGITVMALYFSGVNEIGLLFGGGIVYMLYTGLKRLHKVHLSALSILPMGVLSGIMSLANYNVPFSLPLLFFTFLKIGSILYGSGYVLLAFLRTDFVVRFGWLTDQQLIDAIAIGQVTPGPLFTTATFIGYLLAGIPGAVLGTLGIFLPSFIFVALSNPLIPRIRNSGWVSSLLDGVNIASLGLMAAVTYQLGQASLIDLTTLLITLVSLALLIRFRINSTWLILGGALIGLVSRAFL
jgi:chromate transporter